MKQFSQVELQQVRQSICDCITCYDAENKLSVKQLNISAEAILKNEEVVTAIWNELEANAAFENLLILQQNSVCDNTQIFRSPRKQYAAQAKVLAHKRDICCDARNDAGAIMIDLILEYTGVNLHMT